MIDIYLCSGGEFPDRVGRKEGFILESSSLDEIYSGGVGYLAMFGSPIGSVISFRDEMGELRGYMEKLSDGYTMSYDCTDRFSKLLDKCRDISYTLMGVGVSGLTSSYVVYFNSDGSVDLSVCYVREPLNSYRENIIKAVVGVYDIIGSRLVDRLVVSSKPASNGKMKIVYRKVVHGSEVDSYLEYCENLID